MKNAVILLNQLGMGVGDAALRQKVLATYLRTLLEGEFLPQALLFYTEGVQLCCEGSPTLDSLAGLAARGVQLIVCRTCLESYGLVDKVRVGEIGNMLQIVEAQAAAQKVITV